MAAYDRRSDAKCDHTLTGRQRQELNRSRHFIALSCRRTRNTDDGGGDITRRSAVEALYFIAP